MSFPGCQALGLGNIVQESPRFKEPQIQAMAVAIQQMREEKCYLGNNEAVLADVLRHPDPGHQRQALTARGHCHRPVFFHFLSKLPIRL
jgi:hypothetical protein